MNKIKLIIGLGNPGDKYILTRHNIGFIVLDFLSDHLNLPGWRKNFNGLTNELLAPNGKVLLLKPMTYMNNSGKSVLMAMKFYKIEPKEVIVIYDDLDLDLGRIKIKQGGGSGGHNGIKSIEDNVGKDFYRCRVGISRPIYKTEVTNYVLGNFSKEEMKIVDNRLGLLYNNLSNLLTGNFDLFMNNINQN